jgi:hypothetical protein
MVSAPRIQQYTFGAMTVDGKRFDSDVIIHPDTGARGQWRRASGHLCQEADLRRLLEAGPHVLVIGTGASGLMRVAPEMESRCRAQGVELVIRPTREAVQAFNTAAEAGRRVAGAFHLTC